MVCSIGRMSHAVDAPGSKGSSLLSEVRTRCAEELPGIVERYAELEERGFHRSQFQTLSQVWRSADGAELVARLCAPAALLSERYHVHPAVLDGVVQMVSYFADSKSTDSKAWVPAAIKSLQLHRGSQLLQAEPSSRESGEQQMWASARLVKTSAKARILDLTVYDVITGNVGILMEGFRSPSLSWMLPFLLCSSKRSLSFLGEEASARTLASAALKTDCDIHRLLCVCVRCARKT